MFVYEQGETTLKYRHFWLYVQYVTVGSSVVFRKHHCNAIQMFLSPCIIFSLFLYSEVSYFMSMCEIFISFAATGK